MILYFLKSVSCLALLLFFYHLILEKEKMHNFNRFYLLFGVIISLAIPFATITIDAVPATINTIQTFEEPMFVEQTAPVIVEKSIDYTPYFIGFYILISSILLIRFGRNLFKIIQKIRLNTQKKLIKASLVLVDDPILPHTFWNFIFINKTDYKNGKIEEELFTHELTHVTQKHTIDVLLIELLQAIFWINPLFIFLKKAIQLNHEFLADENVINQHKNTFHYQHILVNNAAWNNEYYLASNLNYSLTKKRLKMMTTQSSKTKIWLKKLAVIPLLAGFVFLFAERVEAQEVIVEEKEVPIETITEEIADNNLDYSYNKLYKEYIYSKGRYTFKDKNGKSITKKYNELTQKEKKALLPPPPLIRNRKIPTSKLIEDLKNSEKYALWINGKVAKNSDLNKYKNLNFSNYSVSFVHKNARSKRFPQEYQASLETKQYFKSKNQKRVNDFLKYLKEKHGIEEVEEEIKPKEIEVKEQKKKYNTPSSRGSKQSINNLNLIKVRILETFIYTDINLYKSKNKHYEELRIKKPHFIKSDSERQQKLNNLFSELGSLYFRLSKENKSKVKRPIHPQELYVRLMKNGRVFYKLRKDLTEKDKLLLPPPPPVPNATKEEILKAKEAYKAWKKRTGNDGVPPPPRPNKKLKNNQEIQLNKYLKLSENYIGNKNRTKKELEKIKKICSS